jgi:hypothetical protein
MFLPSSATAISQFVCLFIPSPFTHLDFRPTLAQRQHVLARNYMISHFYTSVTSSSSPSSITFTSSPGNGRFLHPCSVIMRDNGRQLQPCSIITRDNDWESEIVLIVFVS